MGRSFLLGGENMFSITEKKGQTIIKLTAGDSAEIQTEPFVDADENGVFDTDGNDKPIVLGENDCVLFCVASASGRKYLKKILTSANYNSEDILTMKLKPHDTIDLQPHRYLFSFSYMPDNGTDVYTYSTGFFEILPAVGTIKDLTSQSEITESNTPDIPTDGDDNGN